MGQSHVVTEHNNCRRRFGLHISTQVRALMGSRSPGRSLASGLRTAGRLFFIRRLNAYQYPGLQFDGSGRIRPVIAPLIRIAKEHGWDVEDAGLWLLSGTRYLHGDRPVDNLDNLDNPEVVLEAAGEAWAQKW